MKTNKALKNLVKLSSNVKIYVPSTVNVDKETDNTKQIDNTLSFLSDLFGGSTSYKALGCWQSVDSGLVKEKVTICESYCNQTDLEQYIESIVEYCETLKVDMSQEAISLEVNNNLYFV